MEIFKIKFSFLPVVENGVDIIGIGSVVMRMKNENDKGRISERSNLGVPHAR